MLNNAIVMEVKVFTFGKAWKKTHTQVTHISKMLMMMNGINYEQWSKNKSNRKPTIKQSNKQTYFFNANKEITRKKILQHKKLNEYICNNTKCQSFFKTKQMNYG
jgi:hypothetical protein